MSSSRRSPGVATTATRRFADHDACARPCRRRRIGGQPLDEVAERLEPRRVVRVVDQHLDAVELEHVQPAGRLVDRRRERTQPLPDVVQVGAGGVRRRRGRHRVLHHHPGPALERRGQRVHPGDRHRPAPLADHHHLAERTLLEHDRLAARAGPTVRRGRCPPASRTGSPSRCSACASRRPARRRRSAPPSRCAGRPRRPPLDRRELLERVDVLQPQVVAGHVQDDRDVVACRTRGPRAGSRPAPPRTPRSRPAGSAGPSARTSARWRRRA